MKIKNIAYCILQFSKAGLNFNCFGPCNQQPTNEIAMFSFSFAELGPAQPQLVPLVYVKSLFFHFATFVLVVWNDNNNE